MKMLCYSIYSRECIKRGITFLKLETTLNKTMSEKKIAFLDRFCVCVSYRIFNFMGGKGTPKKYIKMKRTKMRIGLDL